MSNDRLVGSSSLLQAFLSGWVSRVAWVVLGSFIATASFSQSNTLRTYLDELKWNAEKNGPLLVLEPDLVTTKKPVKGWGAFDRKEVVVRQLTAIVPTTMVMIDDSFRQQANLYDGLQMFIKVNYLLTTLTPSQWAVASGRGIGMSDLQGEQKDVFESILPKPFKWLGLQNAEDGEGAKIVVKGTLSDDERLKVRMRLTRGLGLNLYLRDQEGYVTASTFEKPMKPGSISYQRDDSGELDPSEAYGVKVRQVVDNRTKVSHIDYTASSLNASVELLGQEKVIKLLNRIGAATGKQFFADVRVANRQVLVVGKQARAGDLLEALALAVTGTYRNVGGIYLLTSDLAGMGARKLRFDLWRKAIEFTTFERLDEWIKKIGTSGGVATINFDSDDPLGPNDAIRKYLARKDARGKDDFPGQELGPELNKFLEGYQKQYSGQPFTTDKVGVKTQFLFGFVLPDGKKLQSNRQELLLREDTEAQPSNTGKVAPSLKLPIGLSAANGSFPVIINADTVKEAGIAVTAANSHGFGELWLETRSEEVLKEAIRLSSELGGKVRLVIRPFALQDGGDPTDIDLTILGDNVASLKARNDQTPRRVSPLENLVSFPSTLFLLTPQGFVKHSLAKRLLSLSRTPGLAGLVVLGTQPRGYELLRSRELTFSYDGAMVAINEFGYSLESRMTFIRACSIDPIDLVPPILRSPCDLRQPFFLDDELRGGYTAYDGRDVPIEQMQLLPPKWDDYRSKANQDQMTLFLTELGRIAGNKPLLVERRLAMHNQSPCPSVLVSWRSGMNLTQLLCFDTNRYFEGSEGMIMPFTPFANTHLQVLLARMLHSTARPADTRILDLSTIPMKDLLKTLDVWFCKAP